MEHATASPEPLLICPILVGRAAHLEALERTLQQAATGAGRTILISGEAGIGEGARERERGCYPWDAPPRNRVHCQRFYPYTGCAP